MSHPIGDYLASDTDILVAADILGQYLYGDANNDNDKETQCDLLTEDGGHMMDPTRLPYREKIKWHLKEFCYKTSSHGIPMLGQAPNTVYRVIWMVLLTCCGAMFIYQAFHVVSKYKRMEKITDIQLKFDTAPFPAITLCNLNPYRDSLVQDVEAVRKIIKVYRAVMEKAGVLNVDVQRESLVAKIDSPWLDGSLKQGQSKARLKRALANMLLNRPGAKMCKCAFDRESDDAWPCYPEADWVLESCSCDKQGLCQKQRKASGSSDCYCQSPSTVAKDRPQFCVRVDTKREILKLWEYYGQQLMEEDPRIIEALGLQNMTDEVAIVTKAKESIIFAMSELDEKMRQTLSMQKHQLIHKCSFNGQACNIDNDFKLVSDPTFGNCFTFNHERHLNKSSIRAGPSYGLRVLMFVDASDYLPTTEAVGIRMTIHDKDEFPFPDTFGYSAPTGYISSFGMKMQQMSRLPAPYGDCVPDGRTTGYIYADYAYSTEGCYRTCFQEMVVRECGCGDPRFPVLGHVQHCQVFNPEQLSYSEAIWPSQALNISLGKCDMTPEECNEEYQENGAMIEVFYEQLNYEVYTESEAYGIVKMLADFGGQLGLWSGVSFMTVCEFGTLFIELLILAAHHHIAIYRRKKMEKAQADRF
ncbi:unnamed protein product, partial [Mesorhabditis spiculigera]